MFILITLVILVIAVVIIMAIHKKFQGVDACSLETTPRMTNEEIAEKYRTGRIAEMTEKQAGL